MTTSLPGRSTGDRGSLRTEEDENDIERPMLAGHDSSPSRATGGSSLELHSSADSDVESKRSWRSRSRVLKNFVAHNWQRAFILAALIVLIVLISVKGLSIIPDILRWFAKQNDWKGWLAFIGLYCTVVSLYLPGVVLIVGAGFVFGFWKGFLAVWIGGSIGQALAFLLARYLLRDSLAGLLRGKSRRWETVDKAIEMEGWKLLVLLRLSPLVPYNLLNIAMAATKIPFWSFATASCFGIIAECSLFCYFGTLAENITQIASGEAVPHGKSTYILFAVTILMVAVSATWATLIVRRALKRAEAQMRASGEDGGASLLGEAADDAGRPPAHGLSEETRAGGGMHSRPPGMPSLSRRASHDLESAAAALGKSPSTASVLPIVRSTSGVVPPAEGLTMRSHRTSSANSRSVSPADTGPWAASLNTVPLDVRLPPHGKGSRLD